MERGAEVLMPLAVEKRLWSDVDMPMSLTYMDHVPKMHAIWMRDGLGRLELALVNPPARRGVCCASNACNTDAYAKVLKRLATCGRQGLKESLPQCHAATVVKTLGA